MLRKIGFPVVVSRGQRQSQECAKRDQHCPGCFSHGFTLLQLSRFGLAFRERDGVHFERPCNSLSLVEESQPHRFRGVISGRGTELGQRCRRSLDRDWSHHHCTGIEPRHQSPLTTRTWWARLHYLVHGLGASRASVCGGPNNKTALF